MGNLSDFGERAFVNYVLRSQPRPASTYYLGLSTTPFSEADVAVTAFSREPSGNGYARTVIPFGSAAVKNNRSISNASPITFPTATGPWGTISHWGIFDGLGSSANLVAQGTLTGSVPVDNGVTFFIAAGDLEISISNVWALNWGNWILNGFFNTTNVNFTYSSSVFQNSSGVYLSTNSGISALARYLQPASGNTFLAVSTTPFSLGFGTVNLEGGKHRPSQFVSAEALYLTNVSLDSQNFEREPWLMYPTGVTNFRGGSQNLSEIKNNSSRNLGYSRQLLNFSPASTSSGVTTIKNSVDIEFSPATSNWGNIGYWAIYQTNSFSYNQAPSPGTGQIDPSSHLTAFTDLYPIMGGSFSQPATVNAGDILRINAGEFVITPQ